MRSRRQRVSRASYSSVALPPRVPVTSLPTRMSLLYLFYFPISRDYRYTTGSSIKTGLSFVESWGGYQDMHGAFVKWLQMSYGKPYLGPYRSALTTDAYIDDEEKLRREGYPTGSPAETAPSHNSPNSDESISTTNPTNPTTTESTPDPPPSDPPTFDHLPSPSSDLLSSTHSPPDPPTPASLPSDPPTSDRSSPGPLPSDPQFNDPPALLAESSTELQQPPGPEQVGRTTTPVIQPAPSPPTCSPALGTPTPPLLSIVIFEHHPSYPGFITTAVIEHLNSVDGGPLWAEMVKSYLELERCYPSRVSHV